jgi:hypothetical protein
MSKNLVIPLINIYTTNEGKWNRKSQLIGVVELGKSWGRDWSEEKGCSIKYISGTVDISIK